MGTNVIYFYIWLICTFPSYILSIVRFCTPILLIERFCIVYFAHFLVRWPLMCFNTDVSHFDDVSSINDVQMWSLVAWMNWQLKDHTWISFIKDTSSKRDTSALKHMRGHQTKKEAKERVQNRSIKKIECKIAQLIKDREQKCN